MNPQVELVEEKEVWVVGGQGCPREPKHLSAIQKIESALVSVKDGISLKERRDIFSIKILPLLPSLSDTDLDIVIPEIEKRLGVRRTSILKEIKELRGLIQPQGEGKKDRGGYAQERRAQGLTEGRLCYRTNLGWITAGEDYVNEDKLKNPNPLYHFSTRGHNRLLDIVEGKEDSPKMSEVYDRVVFRLVRHISWKNPHHPRVIALWVTGTYFASAFQWYGYLWITSPARRCGKSLLLEIISYLAFNSTTVLVNPRPAYLYRTVDRDFPVVILDELVKFKGDGGDDYAEVLALLNVGAKNGSAVARMEKVGDSFEAKYSQAYCPKALAGLISLPNTLEDRVLRIDMARRKRGDRAERLNLRRCGEELTKLRDDLYLVGLHYDQAVIEFYDKAEELGMPEELDDRLRDISEPLFALASIIDAERGNLDITSSLKSYVLELAVARGADDHGDLAQHTVRALLKLNIQPGDSKVITGKEVMELFRQEPELEWVDTSQKAGRLLNRLGFNSYPYRVGMKQVRGYKISHADLEDGRGRYAEDIGGTP